MTRLLLVLKLLMSVIRLVIPFFCMYLKMMYWVINLFPCSCLWNYWGNQDCFVSMYCSRGHIVLHSLYLWFYMFESFRSEQCLFYTFSLRIKLLDLLKLVLFSPLPFNNVCQVGCNHYPEFPVESCGPIVHMWRLIGVWHFKWSCFPVACRVILQEGGL